MDIAVANLAKATTRNQKAKAEAQLKKAQKAQAKIKSGGTSNSGRASSASSTGAAQVAKQVDIAAGNLAKATTSHVITRNQKVTAQAQSKKAQKAEATLEAKKSSSRRSSRSSTPSTSTVPPRDEKYESNKGSLIAKRSTQGKTSERSSNNMCTNSPKQTCRMKCPSVSCPARHCGMRSGNCCDVTCILGQASQSTQEASNEFTRQKMCKNSP